MGQVQDIIGAISHIIKALQVCLKHLSYTVFLVLFEIILMTHVKVWASVKLLNAENDVYKRLCFTDPAFPTKLMGGCPPTICYFLKQS